MIEVPNSELNVDTDSTIRIGICVQVKQRLFLFIWKSISQIWKESIKLMHQKEKYFRTHGIFLLRIRWRIRQWLWMGLFLFLLRKYIRFMIIHSGCMRENAWKTCTEHQGVCSKWYRRTLGVSFPKLSQNVSCLFLLSYNVLQIILHGCSLIIGIYDIL